MGDEMLAGVCELAFDVAKEGSAPSAMKNYLYLAQRPPRAYSVAQRALEEDVRFRSRVAERATIENVGEAGYLWLHRPTGWEERFSDLRTGIDPVDSSMPQETPLVQRPPMPTPPTPDSVTPATTVPDTPQGVAATTSGAPSPSATPPVEAPPSAAAGPAPTVSSIEDELSSLRGLVDRLADERQNVRSSVSELEVELETRRAENLEMSTKLSALRSELTSVQSSETTILLERDRALARVTELEADVARLTADVQRMAAEAEGSSSEHEAALTDLATVTSERDALQSEKEAAEATLSTVTSERNALQTELDATVSQRQTIEADLASVRGERDALAGVVGERDSLRGELDAVATDRSALTAELDQIRGERDSSRSQIITMTTDLENARGALASAEAKAVELETQVAVVDQLRSDNADLAGRLSVAEQARVDLESQLEDVSQKWQASTRQLSVFENVSSQLDTAVAERDALEAKLVEANDALTVLRQKVGTSHDQIRRELAGVESAFGAQAEQSESAAAETDAGLESAEVEIEAVDDIDRVGEIDVPTFGDVADLDTSTVAPVVNDSVVTDRAADDGAADDSAADAAAEDDAARDDDFDGAGIEMDPTMLGGRTIGDMFRARDNADSTVEQAAEGFLVTPETPDTDAVSDTLADVSGIDAAEIELPNVDTPDIEAVDVGLPEIDVPDMPSVDTPDIDTARADGFADSSADVDPPEPAAAPVSGGRRRLSVAATQDEAAFAREVVESNDVILLIDGDGAAGLGWPHLDVATRRNALVDYLGTLTADSGAAADVVFSRSVGGEDALPVSRAVRVRIADEAVAESSIFASIVNGYPEEWPIAMVTNESALIEQADDLQVTVMNNDQLLDLFLDLNGDNV